MKYFVILIIWILFVLVQPLAMFAALLSLLGGTSTYAVNILRAQDKATATFFGFSGERTVSKECEESECKWCKLLCYILNKTLEDNHCKKAE